MPNWCNTTYYCRGDEAQLHTLHDILNENKESKIPVIENGFGVNWIGNIIHRLGFDWHAYRCRGWIYDFYLDNDDDGCSVLLVHQCTAWVEQKGFRDAIKERFPDISVTYLAEEPGCEVYTTNSAELFAFERYKIDSSIESMTYETIDGAALCVESIVGYNVERTIGALKEACERYNDEHEDDDEYLFVYELQLTD